MRNTAVGFRATSVHARDAEPGVPLADVKQARLSSLPDPYLRNPS